MRRRTRQQRRSVTAGSNRNGPTKHYTITRCTSVPPHSVQLTLYGVCLDLEGGVLQQGYQSIDHLLALQVELGSHLRGRGDGEGGRSGGVGREGTWIS